jgi:hypothetical protein
MKTFIRTAEIWVLSKDHTQLEFGGGLYEAADAFRDSSESLHFGFGEGLPGKAWAAGHPVILKDFSGSGSERIAAAKAAGLTCAAGLPVFAGEFLMAVVVFFCGDDDKHVGAIELWHHDPAISNDLRFADGYFGTADTFEFNARHEEFLRAEQASEIGINHGLGIPYAPVSGHTYVLTFLGARNTPIARRLEVWVPNQTGDALIFHAGDCDQNAALAIEYEGTKIRKQEGLLGQVWLTGMPMLRAIDATDRTPTVRSAVGLRAVIAMPFTEAGKLKAVMTWYF